MDINREFAKWNAGKMSKEPMQCIDQANFQGI